MGHRVIAQVDAFGLFELVSQMIYQRLVEVVAAEVRIAVGTEDLDDVIADIENRYVEGSAAEVEDRNLFVLFPLKAVGKRCGGRLIDNSLDLEPCYFAGVLGCLALRVVEVGPGR
ncbi:unnamed protein product [marine sediment metagenome]|uniref:Uncharacterized protein n=1 Tax=marine sediment metagenome TaxID=412755 RepID=X1AB41_9ZZZZ